LFIGLHTRILDTQNLLTMPDQFREDFRDGLYVTQGFDRNMLMMTSNAFESLSERVGSFSLTNPLARALMRMFLGSAHQLRLRADGQLTVPDSLKEFAQLAGEVVLVGLGDYVEVWSAETWKKQEQQLLNTEGNTDRFSALDLSIQRVSAKPNGG